MGGGGGLDFRMILHEGREGFGGRMKERGRQVTGGCRAAEPLWEADKRRLSCRAGLPKGRIPVTESLLG